MSQFLAVRALLEKDTPKKEIARRLKIDVRTVRNWAKRIQKDGATSTDRRRGPSKLDLHRDLIAEKVQRGLSATQIHDDLRAVDGFDASYVVVRRLVRDLKQREPEVYCRMHYEPGEEMQIDFGEVGSFLVDGQPRRTWLFVATLCQSRYAHYELVLDQTVPTFLGAIQRSFEFFGGVPRRVKPDNLKAAVLLDGLGRRYYQEDFYRFCRHYATLPDAARPRTPTDKGRVERDIRYAKGSFFRGRDYPSFEEAQVQLASWRDHVANVRLHGTTQRRPVDAFEEERAHLLPLPAEAYEIAIWGQHRVRKDCHMQVAYNFYSVPHRFVGERVFVRITEAYVSAFADGEEVARHEREHGRGKTITDPAHYPPEKRLGTQEIHRRRVLTIRSAGVHAAQFLQRLRESRYVRSALLAEFVALIGTWGEDAVDKACARALFYGAIEDVATLDRILERELHLHPLPTDTATTSPPSERDFGRPLSEYADLFEKVAS